MGRNTQESNNEWGDIKPEEPTTWKSLLKQIIKGFIAGIIIAIFVIIAVEYV